MNLIVDQGNTFCKAVLFQHDEIKAQYCVENAKIESLHKDLDGVKIERAIISSVSEPKTIQALLKTYGIEVHNLSYKSKFPIPIDYETPETLGLDRIAAAAGANRLSLASTNLIIDIGTAVTYDIMTTASGFIGGNIAPGLDMRLQAMHTFTRRLPLLERAECKNDFGKSTKEAMINGAQMGILAEIECYMAMAASEYGEISTFLTGGDAPYFEKKIKNSIFAVPNLLAIGLHEILKIN